MPDPHPNRIQGRRVLVVEDDHMVADELRHGLETLGARVLGPVPHVAGALRMLASGQDIDGATVDVTLGREKAFPVADALRARGVPFVFVTGDDQWRLPEVYEGVPRCGKPVDIQRVARALFA